MNRWTILALTFAIAVAEDCDKADILFVLDSSGSVEGDITREKEFIAGVANRLNIGPDNHRIAVLEFSGLVRKLEIGFNDHVSNKADLVSAIKALPYYSGTTLVGKALQEALNVASQRRPSAVFLTVVVTDGISQDDVEAPANALRQIGHVFAVAPTVMRHYPTLRKIADGPDTLLFGIDEAKLVEMMSPFYACKIPRPGQPISHNNTVAPTPAPVASTGAPTPAPSAAGCVLDVMLVVDASGSVTETFQAELQLASHIVQKLRVGPNNARVAMVTFSGPNSAMTDFKFSDHDTQESVQQGIRDARLIAGTTFVGDALTLASRDFGADSGARPGSAKAVSFILSDGLSQQDVKDGAKLLQQKSTVYAVGLGQQYWSRSQLSEIAGVEERVFLNPHMAEFDKLTDQLTSDCR